MRVQVGSMTVIQIQLTVIAFELMIIVATIARKG